LPESDQDETNETMTVKLKAATHKRLKILAAIESRTLAELIDEGLMEYLNKKDGGR
jgi:predicted transcriptional regulator